MPTPYLVNVNFEVTSSVSVQNRLDQSGALSTYILLKPGVGTQFQMRKNDDTNAEVCFRIDRQFVNALSLSLSAALSSSATGVTGSF